MQLETVKDFFISSFFPEKYYLTLIERAGIAKPSDHLFERYGALPYHKMEGLLKRTLQEPFSDSKCEVFETIILGKVSIPLNEMYGCTSSKSPCSDYHIMQNRPNIVIPKNGEEASQLYDVIFERGFGGISNSNEPARVVQQAWDQKKWFVNSDGSHRSSALWSYDCRNNIQRPIDCHVEEIRVNAQCKKFSRLHDIWLFQVSDIESLLELYPLMHHNRDEKGIFEHFRLNCIEQGHRNNNYHYSLVVPHFSELRENISLIMREHGAFNMSDWIKAPQSFSSTGTHALVLPN